MEYLGVQFRGFYPKICKWEELQPNLSLAFSQASKGSLQLQACFEFQNQLKEDPDFLSKVITGDESWCYGYNPETKQQSSQWKSPGSPRPKKARQVKSNIETMLICFFDCRGVVHAEFVPRVKLLTRSCTWRF